MGKDIISLIIFAICVVLFIWNKLPSAVVALMGLCAMILLGVCTFSQGFKNFASSTIILICAMMVVGRATFDTGLAELVGNKVISLAKGNERLIVILGTLITSLISAFLSNIATLAIMISIMTSICSSNGNVKFKNVVMPMSMGAVIGGAATLVGSTTQLTGQGVLETYLGVGNGFTFSTFMIPGFIIIVVLTLYAGFIGYPLGKKIWGKSEGYNEFPIENNDSEDIGKAGRVVKADKVEPNKKKMIIMACIFILTVVMFVLTDLIKKVIPNFNIAMVSLISALACVLTGCITHKNALKSINWNLGIWFCSSLGIAEGLNVSGGGKLMANAFISILGNNVSAFPLFVVFVLFVIILTQFLSNSTVLTMALPIAIPLCMELGYNAFAFAVGMTMAAAMAVATPLANTTIGMSMVAKYKFSDYIKYAGPATLICTVLILIIVPILWPLV
ncbi:MAG: anion permease [Clostridia bacterium]|nr:anion permease [Clostridia bacterium]